MNANTGKYHIAWDEGVCKEVFKEVFGGVWEQKTTKTMCGKQVLMNQIDNTLTNCAKCYQAKHEMEMAMHVSRKDENGDGLMVGEDNSPLGK